MTSPQSSLRRRGRGSISEHSGHARSESDGFGSFVEASTFPSSFDPGLSELLEDAAPSSSAPNTHQQTEGPSSNDASAKTAAAPPIDTLHFTNEDDWTDADMVGSFSPLEQRQQPLAPTPAAQSTSTAANPSMPPKRKSLGTRGASSEWSDWDSFLASHTLPTKHSASSPHAGTSSGATQTDSRAKPTNPADEAFFDAFEFATHQNRAPSPPIIDLRDVERKLNLKEQQQQKQQQPPTTSNNAEDDFFARFERQPQQALGRKSPLVLEPEQLESMHDAKTSPLPTASSHDTAADDSYFGRGRAEPKPISGGKGPRLSVSSGTGGGARTESKSPSGDAAANSFSPASPSSWTGSIRRTWSTLRGIPSELASHLPSASDFIVPPEEGETQSPTETNPGGGLFFAKDEPAHQPEPEDRPRGSLAHISDYSQSTPFGGSSHSHLGFSAGASAGSSSSSGAPLRARDLLAAGGAGGSGTGSHTSSLASSTGTLKRGPLHSNTAPISGAPGFDTTNTRRWNTGHWTLDEAGVDKDKRVIPVTLTDRREETESVIEQWHASRIQAALPPRLQLGKRWKLLYSLDQHGISLQTLYHRVSAGLDPTKSRVVSGSGAGNAEGWLRGASKAAQEAMGTTAGNGAGGAKNGHNGRLHVGGGLTSISDAGLVLAIKDEDDNVFGAFVNEKLRPQQHYYGSGECFLWKTASSSIGTGPAPTDEHIQQIEVFKWTGKNDYMVLSETTFLSVGGGNGKFGLWVDGNLEKGVSDACPAFDNEVLCDTKPRGKGEKDGEKRFTCYGLEVWAVGMD
ncbi:TLD-domain-containing protein [Testicularia cyperi]|uniref:Oxidation resistance protein 1 n=1 Tax=Testicularia cyperi TaxID=1882483 RepID=A0A317XFX7_9BASI|nr:TLD-domain-containing protein [Testicularia cyperi]